MQASFATMTAIAALLAPPRALANPTGGVVVDGAATISSTTNVTNVVQSTNRAIINWQGFSIGVGETVNFLQPTAMSVTLNRGGRQCDRQRRGSRRDEATECGGLDSGRQSRGRLGQRLGEYR
jgi:hypothetical protein